MWLTLFGVQYLAYLTRKHKFIKRCIDGFLNAIVSIILNIRNKTALGYVSESRMSVQVFQWAHTCLEVLLARCILMLCVRVLTLQTFLS